MGDHNGEHEMGMGSDIDLMNSDLHIVQDVEADLEEYTRLNRLGRFGEASKLFRETLQRHIGCFAVLAEHCNALIYQGNYAHACLVLQDSIAKQELPVTGSLRFRTSEIHFLRVSLTYVKIFAEKDERTGSKEAKIAVTQARWYRDTIARTEIHDLADVERQILLTCLRIFVVFVEEDFASIEDLHLPWSSRPSYPGETMNLAADYLAWFESLLSEHPWDAYIILQCIGLLQQGNHHSQDWSIMTDMVERAFPGTDTDDIHLFARMLLLGNLCEMTLNKRWCMPGFSEEVDDLGMIQIVVDSDSERLAEIIQYILQQHSGVEMITDTRPYKYLQLLIIDHELIRELKAEDAQKVVIKILSRLSAIEKYATSSGVMDHRLAMEVLYHHYILQPRENWRKTMLNKIAHFTSRFGKTQETIRLYSSFAQNRNLFSATYCHPNCAHVTSRIIRFSEELDDINDIRSRGDLNDKSPQRLQSIFERVLQSIGDPDTEETWISQSYSNPDISKLQPAPASTSHHPYEIPHYSNPPVSGYPGYNPYPPRPYPQGAPGPSPGNPFMQPPGPFDPRYIASTEANPDTIKLPERPRKLSKSSVRARHKQSDRRSDAYKSSGDSF